MTGRISLKFGSLFTGVGGFDLAFERAGMECAWQVEIDPYCQKILNEHWKDVPKYDDVKNVGKHNLKTVDLICGGFPCQDLSVAGKRAGFDGERSSLWFEFERIIDEMQPKWVVIENVPGLLSSKKGSDFGLILQSLDELGYGVAWRVLDSQYFGVAQRRRRVFVVGSFGNGGAAEILFEREGVRWNIEKGREAGKGTSRTIAPSLTASNDPSRSPQSNEITRQVEAVIRASTFTIRTRSEGGGKGYLGLDDGAMTLGGQPQWVMSSGQANAEIMSERSPALTGLHEQPIVMAYENHTADSRITETGDISQQLTSRMGTGGGNVPLVQELTMASGVRRLTPTECERLQGFPDGWTASQSDTQRYKMMGNAITVNVAEWIGKRIVKYETD